MLRILLGIGLLLTLSNIPPVANFTADCGGLICRYTNTSSDADGQITEFRWHFPNGDEYDTESVLRSYPKDGDYNVMLEVTDDAGAVDTIVKRISVAHDPANQLPVASFASACTDLLCVFNNTSTDADGTVEGNGWNFGDSVAVASFHAIHEFDSTGTYNVRLIVIDNLGGRDTTTASVSVKQ